MEDGLVHARSVLDTKLLAGLNPCCSGQWSRTHVRVEGWVSVLRVLILVVMEDGLVPGHGLRKLRYLCVLILVVVEDGLVRTTAIVALFHSTSLNPYCNGR